MQSPEKKFEAISRRKRTEIIQEKDFPINILLLRTFLETVVNFTCKRAYNIEHSGTGPSRRPSKARNAKKSLKKGLFVFPEFSLKNLTVPKKNQK